VSLTVACVLVRGNVPYTPEYVLRLARMTRRGFGGRAFRFVCLTDQPEAMPAGVDTIKITPLHGMPGWWSKIELFNPAHDLRGRIVYFDLDVLIVNRVDVIAEYPAGFALIPDGAPNFKPHNGLAVVKRFNSSVMTWDAGVHPEIFTAWTPAVANAFWGDQDWLGALKPGLARMPLDWFPRLSEIDTATPKWPDSARVILAKKPKNAEAAKRWPWFAKLWG
jgi:hypothetical protein